jgi:hypothetical protein
VIDALNQKLKEGNVQEISKLLNEISEAKKNERVFMKPLVSPPFLKPLRYVRCNCREGVPTGNRMYEPVLNPMKLGDIFIMNYDRILADEGKRFDLLVTLIM